MSHANTYDAAQRVRIAPLAEAITAGLAMQAAWARVAREDEFAAEAKKAETDDAA